MCGILCQKIDILGIIHQFNYIVLRLLFNLRFYFSTSLVYMESSSLEFMTWDIAISDPSKR